MVRSTALVLVIALGLASVRLLACGWDCTGPDPLQHDAGACHEPGAGALPRLSGGGHPCNADALLVPGVLGTKAGTLHLGSLGLERMAGPFAQHANRPTGATSAPARHLAVSAPGTRPVLRI
jgi:hypothetical protein